jgi:hypothetical protein
MNKRTVALIAGAIILLALLGGGLLYMGRDRAPADDGSAGMVDEAARRRTNTLKLAQDYFEGGEYQRALDLLDGLLIENADDETARDLRDRIILERRKAEEAAAAERQQSQEDLKDTLSGLGDTIKSGESSARDQARAQELEAQRQAELRQLEEQRRAAEERRRQEEARLAALSQAEREKAEKLKELVQRGEQAMSREEYI